MITFEVFRVVNASELGMCSLQDFPLCLQGIEADEKIVSPRWLVRLSIDPIDPEY